MTLHRRESTADWLMVLGGVLLLAALFMPWSHQLSAAIAVRFGGTGALSGVPRDPNAWQVYSSVDVLLALLAAGLVAAAMRGERPARLVLLGALVIAVAFTIHAIAVPPTNGLVLYAGGSGYAPLHAGAGTGETFALLALALGIAGLLLSFTADR